jgi:hypothetical protein
MEILRSAKATVVEIKAMRKDNSAWLFIVS